MRMADHAHYQSFIFSSFVLNGELMAWEYGTEYIVPAPPDTSAYGSGNVKIRFDWSNFIDFSSIGGPGTAVDEFEVPANYTPPPNATDPNSFWTGLMSDRRNWYPAGPPPSASISFYKQIEGQGYVRISDPIPLSPA